MKEVELKSSIEILKEQVESIAKRIAALEAEIARLRDGAGYIGPTEFKTKQER